MFNPRSLVYALYTHWDTVEVLVRLSREFAAFTSEQALSAISKVAPHLDAEGQGTVLRSLVNADVLQTMPRSSDLQSFLPMTARDLEEVLDAYAYGDRGKRMFLQSIPKPDVVMRLSLLAESAGLLDL